MSQVRKINHEINDLNTLTASRQVKKYGLGLLVAVALGLAAVAPYFFSHTVFVDGKRQYQLIQTHDIRNHYFFMNEFEKAVRSGVIYPRWYDGANNGYGIAVANYYPPGLYYVTTIANAIFRNWHTTLFVLLGLMMAAAGLAMYFLARTFFGRLASAAAAGLYMLLPYHLIDLYWRFALAEIFGFVFLPLIFYFAYRAGSRGRWRDGAALGLFYGLHLLTHFPVGLMFSYVLVFYAVVWAIQAKDWRIIARIATGMGIGLAIGAIYWLPAALEMNLVYEYTQEIFPYHLSYINPVPNGEPFLLTIQYALKLNALLLIVSGLILRQSSRSRAADRSITDAPTAARQLQIRLWMMLGVAALFMTTAFSYDIGRWLPKLELTVPPFRWLGIGMTFGALLAGACVDCLRRGEDFTPRRLWMWRAAFGLVIGLNLWVSYSLVINEALKNGDFTPADNYIESSLTPRDATHPEQLPDTPLVMIEPAGGTSDIVAWKPHRREIRVRVEQASRVRLKTYNFAGWTAWLDGTRVPLISDADGIQVVEVPVGMHTIEVEFQNTAPRWAGTLISGLGFLTVFALILVNPVERRARRGGRASSP